MGSRPQAQTGLTKTGESPATPTTTATESPRSTYGNVRATAACTAASRASEKRKGKRRDDGRKRRWKRRKGWTSVLRQLARPPETMARNGEAVEGAEPDHPRCQPPPPEGRRARGHGNSAAEGDRSFAGLDRVKPDPGIRQAEAQKLR